MMYIEYLSRKKVSEILKTLKKRIGSIFNDEQLEQIVNQLDVFKSYSIEVTSDPNKFATLLTNIEDIMKHSWAGHDRYYATIEKVLFAESDYNIGKIYKYEYYNNGNLTNSEYKHEHSNFDINKRYAILIEKNYDKDYNNSYSNFTEYKLVFYVPETYENLLTSVVSEFIQE